jgi:hypothetical protein
LAQMTSGPSSSRVFGVFRYGQPTCPSLQ